MAFRIGQKVVCIDQKNSSLSDVRHSLALQEGNIYTIRAVGLIHGRDPAKNPCVLIEERARQDGADEDCPIWASRFRPLIEKYTASGMAILREIIDRENINDKPPVKVSETPAQDAGLRNQ